MFWIFFSSHHKLGICSKFTLCWRRKEVSSILIHFCWMVFQMRNYFLLHVCRQYSSNESSFVLSINLKFFLTFWICPIFFCIDVCRCLHIHFTVSPGKVISHLLFITCTNAVTTDSPNVALCHAFKCATDFCWYTSVGIHYWLYALAVLLRMVGSAYYYYYCYSCCCYYVWVALSISLFHCLLVLLLLFCYL